MKSSSSQTTARTPSSKVAAVAGLFDAEGCICGSLSNGYGHVNIEIRQKNPVLLQWLSGIFPGYIRECGKNIHSWSPNDPKHFLKSIKQYLHVKRQQAECALAFVSLPPAPKKRIRLAEKIKRLNNVRHPACAKGIISRVTGRPRRVSKTNIAYTALFLEGDGRLGKSQMRFYNINIDVLTWLQQYWGGTLVCCAERGMYGRIDPYYYLALLDEQKYRLLRLVRSFLVTKQDAAEAMIARLEGKI